MLVITMAMRMWCLGVVGGREEGLRRRGVEGGLRRKRSGESAMGVEWSNKVGTGRS